MDREAQWQQLLAIVRLANNGALRDHPLQELAQFNLAAEDFVGWTCYIIGLLLLMTILFREIVLIVQEARFT